MYSRQHIKKLSYHDRYEKYSGEIVKDTFSACYQYLLWIKFPYMMVFFKATKKKKKDHSFITLTNSYLWIFGLASLCVQSRESSGPVEMTLQ